MDFFKVGGDVFRVLFLAAKEALMGGSYLRYLQINGIVPVGMFAINADNRCIGTVVFPLFDPVLLG
ncbi:hypothetical protein [Mucilaginibacter sp. HD30]